MFIWEEYPKWSLPSWLHLSREVRLPPNKCPVYDTKQSDGEVPVMQELWGMRSTLSISSLPDPLWPGMVEPDKTLSMGQIELYLH